MRKQLWQSRTELQQQTEFCSALGSASCVLLWSSSVKENTVTQWLADVSHLAVLLWVCVLIVQRPFGHLMGTLFGYLTMCAHVVQRKLQPFLTIACQSLENFFESVNEDVPMDQNSQEHQFALAVAGTITSKLPTLVNRTTFPFCFAALCIIMAVFH